MSDNLPLMAQQAFAVDWVAGACLAVLLYDHLVTFDDEVNRMWTLRNGIPKTLFILNRYVVSPMLIFNGIASSRKALSAGFCVFYLRWLVCTITVTTFVIEGILTLRVLALYRNNKIVSSVALFFYITGVSTLVGLTIKDYVGERVVIISDFAELPGCYAAAVPGLIAGYWITQVVVESVLFSMTLFKTVQYMRETGRRSAPPTLVLLARDSTIWYSIVFLLLMTNLLMFEFAPPFLSSLMVTPVNTAGCIAGSRLLLNLRGIAHSAPTSVVEGATEMTTVLRFADVVSWKGRKGRSAGAGASGGKEKGRKVGMRTGTTTTGTTTSGVVTEGSGSGSGSRSGTEWYGYEDHDSSVDETRRTFATNLNVPIVHGFGGSKTYTSPEPRRAPGLEVPSRGYGYRYGDHGGGGDGLETTQSVVVGMLGYSSAGAVTSQSVGQSTKMGLNRQDNGDLTNSSRQFRFEEHENEDEDEDEKLKSNGRGSGSPLQTRIRDDGGTGARSEV